MNEHSSHFMRAIVYDRYGGPEVLRETNMPRPRRAPGKIIVRVVAAGVNPVDYRLRNGEARYVVVGGFPRIPGYDVAGYVEFASPGTGYQPGDRVLSYLDNIFGGGYAEFAGCSDNALARIPSDMSFVEAAGLPLAGSTALQSLYRIGHLEPGAEVLIHGASGGVGSLAVQIAVAYGARVTGTCRSDHMGFVRDLGAHDVIDYRAEDFSRRDMQWDIVFDAAGKGRYGSVRRVLKPGGHYVTTEPSVQGLAMTLLTAPLAKRGHTMLARPRANDLRELTRLVAAGQLRVFVQEVLPLREAAEAHRRLEAGGLTGKLILRVSDD